MRLQNKFAEDKTDAILEASLSYKIGLSSQSPTRQEILDLFLKRENESVTSFDEKTDAYLESQALKRLEERRQASGK